MQSWGNAVACRMPHPPITSKRRFPRAALTLCVAGTPLTRNVPAASEDTWRETPARHVVTRLLSCFI